MAAGGVDVDIAGGIATVTINRPDKANALDGPMHHALTTIWQELESDEHVGAAVITGAGSTFCAGGDRSKWPALAEDRRYRRRRMIEARQLVLNLLRCTLPVVAAVNGPAVGVGCTIVAACDIVLMSTDAYLADPHVMAGIVAGDGAAALLPEVLPLALARQLLFTGARLDAPTALSVHFAAEVVAPADLLERATTVAARLATIPWEALRDTKRTINLAVLQRVLPSLELGSTAEAASFDTPEFRTEEHE